MQLLGLFSSGNKQQWKGQVDCGEVVVRLRGFSVGFSHGGVSNSPPAGTRLYYLKIFTKGCEN